MSIHSADLRSFKSWHSHLESQFPRQIYSASETIQKSQWLFKIFVWFRRERNKESHLRWLTRSNELVWGMFSLQGCKKPKNVGMNTDTKQYNPMADIKLSWAVEMANHRLNVTEWSGIRLPLFQRWTSGSTKKSK